MVTREERLSGFEVTKPPEAGVSVELLCEDHNGTYLLPFPCRFADGDWRNADSNELVEARIVGWRHWTRSGTSDSRRR